MAMQRASALRNCIIAIGLGLTAPAAAWEGGPGRDGSMEFRLASTGGNCPTCTFVAAEGVITATTPDDLRSFLAASRGSLMDPRGATLHLDSPGGSLVGGILFGEAIRAAGLNTVAAYTPGSILPNGWIDVRPDTGAPAGICVFALAGGVIRYAARDTDPYAVGFQAIGEVGVYQFYNPIGLRNITAEIFTAQDRIEDQLIVAELIAFLDRMDVSAELLQLALGEHPASLRILTDDELRRTRLDNATV